MIFLVFGFLLFSLIIGPQLWVKYVLNKYSVELEGMPGTGGELAQHILQTCQLDQVRLEAAEPGTDHYDPQENVVRRGNADTTSHVCSGRFRVSYIVFLSVYLFGYLTRRMGCEF